VGAGPGYFRDAFERAGARYIGLDVEAGDLAGQGGTAAAVVGSGMGLPFRTSSIDISYSSNVLEHVPRPWLVADELVRVTRPGGVVYLSFTVWYGPWGGHETSPWHYLGGRLAAERYARRHGRRPKNDFGRSLFRVDVGDALRWSGRQTKAEVLGVFPRYAPSWAFGLVRLPVLREVATWNLVLVLRKRAESP
jgi:SAM-dependent methyltransferase